MEKDSHSLELARYVVLDPVRAGMVGDAGAYLAADRLDPRSVLQSARLSGQWVAGFCARGSGSAEYLVAGEGPGVSRHGAVHRAYAGFDGQDVDLRNTAPAASSDGQATGTFATSTQTGLWPWL